MMPVYVINLERQPELRKRISLRLESLGVAYEIFNAIDGATLDPSQYADRLDDRKTLKLRLKQGLTCGEIGCYLSHYQLWQRIVADGSPYAVILEDDAILADDFPDVLETLPNIDWYWDVVRLSASRPYKVTQVLCPIGHNRVLASYRDPVLGTVAYVISLHGAQALCDYCYVIQQQIDISYEEWWKSGLHFFAIQPPVVDFTDEHSTLIAEREAAAWIKIQYPLHLRARNFLLRKLDLASRYVWGMRNPPRRV